MRSSEEGRRSVPGPRATVVVALLAGASGALAQEAPAVREVPLFPDSRVALEGTATTGAWSCHSIALRADLRVESRPKAATADLEAARLRVPVDGIRCGLAPMERDLRRALQAERHPWIVFRLQEMEPAGSRSDGLAERLGVRVSGDLTVAGTRRPLTMTVGVAIDSAGTVRLAATTRISMTDFEIVPPSAMLGLIRADDTVSIHLELLTSLPSLADALDVDSRSLLDHLESWAGPRNSATEAFPSALPTLTWRSR